MSKVKKKRKYKYLLLIIIILLLALGITYYIYTKQENNKLKVNLKKELNIEINSEVTIDDIVDNIINGTLVNGSDKLDTSVLGNNKIKLIIKDKEDKEEEYEFTVKIVDTISPVIKAKDEITSYVGRDLDLLKDVSVSDNSLEELEIKIKGDYDLNKEGEYPLEYTSTDSSKNEGKYAFLLKVISDENNRTFKTSKGFLAKVIDGVTYIDGLVIANKTYKLPSNYGDGLTSETQNAFNEMKADASAIGLNLWLSSGFRSYSLQDAIYNNYVARDGQAAADTYSARAGHSEHQTGYAFDLNTIEDSFAYTAEGKWVHDNCQNYGLILRYPKGKEDITGYKYESWHMRYVGVDLAKKLYNDGDWITLEEYFGIDSKYN